MEKNGLSDADTPTIEEVKASSGDRATLLKYWKTVSDKLNDIKTEMQAPLETAIKEQNATGLATYTAEHADQFQLPLLSATELSETKFAPGDVTPEASGQYLDSLEKLSSADWGALTEDQLHSIGANLDTLQASHSLTEGQDSQYQKMNALVSMGTKFAEGGATPEQFAAYVDVNKTLAEATSTGDDSIDWSTLASTLSTSSEAFSTLAPDSDIAFYADSAQGSLVQEAILNPMSKFKSTQELSDSFAALAKLPAEEQDKLMSVVTGTNSDGEQETLADALGNTLVSGIAKNWSTDDAMNQKNLADLFESTEDMSSSARAALFTSIAKVANPETDAAFPSSTSRENVSAFYSEFTGSHEYQHAVVGGELASLTSDVSTATVPTKGTTAVRQAYTNANDALGVATHNLEDIYAKDIAGGKTLSTDELKTLGEQVSELQDAHDSLQTLHSSIQNGGTGAAVRDFFDKYFSTLSKVFGGTGVAREAQAQQIEDKITAISKTVSDTLGTHSADGDNGTLAGGDGTLSVQGTHKDPSTIPGGDDPTDHNGQGPSIDNGGNTPRGPGEHDGGEPDEDPPIVHTPDEPPIDEA
jgi:hypothetical protein